MPTTQNANQIEVDNFLVQNMFFFKLLFKESQEVGNYAYEIRKYCPRPGMLNCIMMNAELKCVCLLIFVFEITSI